VSTTLSAAVSVWLLRLVTVPAPLLELGLVPQCLEARVPELLEEGPQLAEPLGSGAVQATRAVAPLDQQTGITQDPQVLRDRRPGHVAELRRDRPGGQLAVAHEPEDLSAPGLDNSVQHCLHLTNCKVQLT
jgi:hypothetical protein